jgi:hypothetical protein
LHTTHLLGWARRAAIDHPKHGQDYTGDFAHRAAVYRSNIRIYSQTLTSPRATELMLSPTCCVRESISRVVARTFLPCHGCPNLNLTPCLLWSQPLLCHGFNKREICTLKRKAGGRTETNRNCKLLTQPFTYRVSSCCLCVDDFSSLVHMVPVRAASAWASSFWAVNLGVWVHTVIHACVCACKQRLPVFSVVATTPFNQPSL